MAIAVGVDVGGTFTDIISIDSTSGEIRVAKVPTTPQDQSIGFADAMSAVGQHDLAEVELVCHGTTTGTNTVLERNGARCGLITTRGFRDTLEIGMRTRPQPYGLFGEYVPLISRNLRLEVPERMNADGEVVVPLDEDAVREAARQLRTAGAESVVIAFLHSYANPAHERRAEEIVRQEWPNEYVTVSHRILSEFREFQRLSTAAVNAYIQPRIDRYFGRLAERLRTGGYRNDLLIMRSNGGCMRERLASQLPVQTVLSGPAAGVTAAARICALAGHANVLTADVGGTSFDVGLIVDGMPETSPDSELGYNIPVRLPMIDIHTIGAGGGSIARLDGTGLLKVGPESAGAQPGPVAFGRGGERPTLTDAYMVTGRLDPNGILSVSGTVDMRKVRDAIATEVGDRLGLGVEEAAQAIIRVANDRMAGAARSVTLARGYDPRDFVYFAFGGGGGLNAVEIARELGMPTVLVPPRPGIASALGTLVANGRHDFVQTINRRVEDVSLGHLAAIVDGFAKEGKRLLEEERLSLAEVQVLPVLEVQYEGQTHTISVPFSADATWEDLLANFSAQHEQAYGMILDDIPHKVVNVRCAVVGVRNPVGWVETRPDEQQDIADAIVGHRRVLFGEQWHDTPVYRRERMPATARFHGPAIVEQSDCTTLLDPACLAEFDAHQNLVITLEAPVD